MKKTINTALLGHAVTEMIHEASFSMPPEVERVFARLAGAETSELAAETLRVLRENIGLARRDEIPLCQDCGMTIVFLEVGQELCWEGEPIADAINAGVAEAYGKLSLRCSIVADPLRRKNTGSNTPAFIHTEFTAGDRVRLTVYLKGGGSENMTALRTFKPTDSTDAIIDWIEAQVIEAGPNPCPPLFLGIGIGGSADECLVNAKKAVLRGVETSHPDPFYRELEERITARLNATNVGPLGFGGVSTAAGVFIKEAPSHIACLPVALNMNCHSLRWRTREL